MTDPKKRAQILERIAALGGLTPGVARQVARETGVPEADVYGAGSFFHLLAEPDTRVRVCTGLSCKLGGAVELLDHARAAGLPVDECSCLAACDRPPAVLRARDVLVEVSAADVDRAAGDWQALQSAAEPKVDWVGAIGPTDVADDQLAMNLGGDPDYSGTAYARAVELGADAVIGEIDRSGLQGRGGAGFPAAVKWHGVRDQDTSPHYVVLNADEGEPATFKDRELMLRRPDLVLEGLAIAAHTVGASEVYLYLRGEFGAPWRAMENAIARFGERGLFDGIEFHLHPGHGAYICGEETALLEALEGKRGMPRLKPPYPNTNGLWGKPTLVQNVETIACVPAIVMRGGAWFEDLGRTEPGTKIYSLSGHVARPGNYELPLGVSLDELVEAAGGYVGELRAFSPGGASSGFLPASERGRPLDFKGLAAIGSMLGSAGVVVLNGEADLVAAVHEQLCFFERESCGQCAPCRIGTRFIREAVDRYRDRRGAGAGGARGELAQSAEVAWEMNEGSICGLGQAAPLALTTAMKHFPEEFTEG
jgi:NADH:ubiquinone oxidoreductase subunit F (NADH-binding)